MRIPVFMYHALLEDGKDVYEADLHYAISLSEFESQVKYCSDHGFVITSISDVLNSNIAYNIKLTIFTFDDGHVSNYSAAKILNRYKFKADFFVNSEKIGETGFLSKQQINEMYIMGMSIQSHSHTHTYISDHEELRIKDELRQSKSIIEQHTTSVVDIFAPPGGRISSLVIRLAKDIGYIAIANSKPGYWRSEIDVYNIPRIPILASTDSEVFIKFLTQDFKLMFKLMFKYKLTRVLKLALGNKMYENIRIKVLG